ncbi:MAG: bifunctional phosphopantothenoylcysteine decarboxylase/phosphopantothenate--cysteine ligase CoaBC [Desulfobacteraceae bacterium]|nr:bifunctional phosphopantothenoylcysteine decarboxylase/phosphopantothenate--cysteine ligase CoaBC [Desulfobacteraceae bacterium]
MAASFAGKNVLLGVTGSIAAYKTADWARALGREGASVRVVMTGAAGRFVTPLTFAALTGHEVHADMFAPAGAETIPHIRLARESDLVLIAPATATTIARLANGLADDLLAAIVLATRAPVVVCPAMNCAMYQHPATGSNFSRLAGYGYRLVTPEAGAMACGEEGPGRLPEWDAVRESLLAALSPQDLAGRRFLVTAGPTHEPLDPVRYLGNRSSGRMGYALARTAHRRGADVILISGPTHLPSPPGVETIRVRTAAEMHRAVLDRLGGTAAVVKAAAVSDFRPASCADQKIKKSGPPAALPLAANEDILAGLGRMKKERPGFPLLVGFAAESRNHLAEGRRKLEAKNLDLIAVNDILATDAGFGAETNRLLLLDRSGRAEELPLLSKEEAADRLWDRVASLLASSCQS